MGDFIEGEYCFYKIDTGKKIFFDALKQFSEYERLTDFPISDEMESFWIQ